MKHILKKNCTLLTALTVGSIVLHNGANAFVPSSSSSHFSLPSRPVVYHSSKCSQSSSSLTRKRISSRAKVPTLLFMTTSSSPAALPDVQSMRVGELKKELESYGMSTKSYLEKSELVQAVEKARAEGKTPINMGGNTASSTTERNVQDSTTSSSPSSSSGMSREERLAQEIEKCNAMKAGELKKELESYGISTASFFEKSEFVQACAEARVDGVSKKTKSTSTGSANGEGYAEYTNVEVITDDSTGPGSRNRNDPAGGEPRKGTGMRSGGPGIRNPFAGPGMNMGFMQDMMKNMGGMGGAGNPFAGGGASSANPFAGGANPFGGGMPGGMGGGDAMKKAQEMMNNPKVREIMMKAQSNPKIMRAVQECMGNPAAFAKYRNDPDVGELIRELQRYM